MSLKQPPHPPLRGDLPLKGGGKKKAAHDYDSTRFGISHSAPLSPSECEAGLPTNRDNAASRTFCRGPPTRLRGPGSNPEFGAASPEGECSRETTGPAPS